MVGSLVFRKASPGACPTSKTCKKELACLLLCSQTLALHECPPSVSTWGTTQGSAQVVLRQAATKGMGTGSALPPPCPKGGQFTSLVRKIKRGFLICWGGGGVGAGGLLPHLPRKSPGVSPGGPVAKTPHFPCRGVQVGNKLLTWPRKKSPGHVKPGVK